MDRLHAMSVFISVVEAGSFSAAARTSGLPLATISRKVAELEAHLCVSLVTRSARGVILTESGEAYYADCRRLLDDLAETERAASGEYRTPRGELVITAPIVFGRMHLTPVVVAFLAAYPDVDICLRLRDDIVHLVEEHVDLAVRISQLPDSSMVAKRITDIRHVVCASPAYLAARGVPRHPADLANHDCISGKPLATPDLWSFRLGKSLKSFTIHRRLATTTAEAAIEAAITGAGLARVLCYQVVEAEAAGDLVTVLRDFEPQPTPLSLVYPAARRMPLKLRAFLDFAVPRLKARLAG